MKNRNSPSSPGCSAKRFLTATLFHGRLENSSSEFSKMSPPDTRSASKAYAQVAQAVLNPRDLEASLLLKAAAKLQAALEAWDQKPPSGLSDALLYNGRLWIVFIDAVMRDDNRLPIEHARTS
jgi:Flagellar protein FlaF